MSIKTPLKVQLAAAALTAGLTVSSPIFAQDAERDGLDLGVPSTTSQQQNSVSSGWELGSVNLYNSTIPINYFYLLAAFGVLGVGYYGFNKKRPPVLKGAALAFGLAAIAAPQISLDQHRVLPTIVPVFVDKSLSAGDRAPHNESAFKVLQDSLSALGAVDIRRVNFGSPEDGDSEGTYLSPVLETTLSSIDPERLGGSFVISDGVLADQDQFLSAQSDQPIHGLIVGHEREQDFYIEITKAPHTAFTEKDHSISLNVTDARNPSSSDLTANIIVSYAGQELKTITVPVNELQEIKLLDLGLSDGLSLGQNVFEFSIDSIEGGRVSNMDLDGDGQLDEVSTLNNKTAINITGISSNIKVLLLSDTPHPGINLWRDTLKKDPSISLTHFGNLHPRLKQDAAVPLRDLSTVAFPVEEVLGTKINEFSFVILENSRNFNGVIPIRYFENIAEYVKNGGSLIVVENEDLVAPNGLTQTPLQDLIPFISKEQKVTGQFTPILTQQGARHPIGRSISRSGVDWGPWYEIVAGEARQGALTLMSDDRGNPLLITNRVGEGRVSVFTSDQAFVWASGHKGGGPATGLYQALSGWSAGNPRYDEERLVVKRSDGEILIELQTLKDEPEPIVIITPSGQEIEVIPEGENGLYTVSIPADENGTYKARRRSSDVPESQAITGQEYETELRHVVSDTEILRPLSDQTKGNITHVLTTDGTVQLPDVRAKSEGNNQSNLDQFLVDLSEKRERVSSRPIGLPGWFYASLFILLSAASFRQKEIGDKVPSFLGSKSAPTDADLAPEPEVQP